MFSKKALKPHLAEIIDYKTQTSQEERTKLAKDLQNRYPGRVPIVFLKSRKSKAVQIENNKMLFQPDSRLNQIIGVLHKKLKEDGSTDTDKTGIFITMDGNISPRISTRLDTLYACYADEDGFLYMVYSEEDTTGSDQA